MNQADALLKLADDFEEAVNTMRSNDPSMPMSGFDKNIEIPVEEVNRKSFAGDVAYMSGALNRLAHYAQKVALKMKGISHADFNARKDEFRAELKSMGEELFTIRNTFVTIPQA